MDYRIESFLMDVVVLLNVKKQFRNAEPDKRMKEKAAQSCRALCRSAFSKRYLAVKNSDSRAFDAGARRHRARPTRFPPMDYEAATATLDKNTRPSCSAR
jgi:hypothetical protein